MIEEYKCSFVENMVQKSNYVLLYIGITQKMNILFQN